MLPRTEIFLPIIEHVFHCITQFACQILSCIHTFGLHTNRLKVDADYIPELCFFSRDFESNRGCGLCTTADNRSGPSKTDICDRQIHN